MNRVIPFFSIILLLLGACKNTAVSEDDLKYISDEDGVVHDCNITDSILGIDISHHNGPIDWEVLHQHHPEIEFVYIRATVGLNKDSKYEEYVNGAKQVGIKTGAYHYYWANRNSTVQFNNFKSWVKKGDHNLIPVLDIEKPSKYGPANLRRGLSNWLKLAEEEYGVKPMIYTNLSFYNENLRGYFNEYPKWIAAYSRCPSSVDWDVHQNSETGRLRGISGNVDLNYSSTLLKLSFFN